MRRCLESLRRLQYPELSILVVENDASSGESEGIALNYGADYRLYKHRGLSAARNFGARSSTSELLAFIDDDAICESNWLSNAASLFAVDRVLAVAGKIVFHSDNACTSVPVQVFDPGNLLIGPETPDWLARTDFGSLGLGSNLVVRRAVFKFLGGFEERLGRGSTINCWEENHLLFRIVDVGYRVATCSDAVVHHPVLNPHNSNLSFRSVAASTFMVTMLAIEHSRRFPELIGYFWGAVWRKSQAWRNRPSRPFNNLVSPWILYSALAAGPFIYLLSSLRWLISRPGRFFTASTEGPLSPGN